MRLPHIIRKPNSISNISKFLKTLLPRIIFYCKYTSRNITQHPSSNMNCVFVHFFSRNSFFFSSDSLNSFAMFCVSPCINNFWINLSLTTHPSSKSTLSLTSRLAQNVGLGEGQVGSFPDLNLAGAPLPGRSSYHWQ